jgi:hypothetical protein
MWSGQPPGAAGTVDVDPTCSGTPVIRQEALDQRITPTV